MKQTTIQIYVEEAICGATVFATSRRTKWSQYGETKSLPIPEEENAWKLIAGDNAQWGIGKSIEPKEGEFDELQWFKNLSERIERVCNNRKFKSKVRVLEQVSQGYAVKWSVTFYWNKPTDPPSKDTHGVWTLKEFKGTARRGKIIDQFDGILECLGDDHYWRLPDTMRFQTTIQSSFAKQLQKKKKTPSGGDLNSNLKRKRQNEHSSIT